jgi:hypothetical protein
MADQEQSEHLRELRDNSDELMRALEDMKRTEARKRGHPVSTPKFHALADDVEKKSERLFRLAKGEISLADEIDTTDQTIRDTPPHRPRES